MTTPHHPDEQTWHLRVEAKDTSGTLMTLLDQPVVWLATPPLDLLDYGFQRWELFMAGMDPLCPDVPARLESGELREVTAFLTDNAGVTATFGPVVGGPDGA